MPVTVPVGLEMVMIYDSTVIHVMGASRTRSVLLVDLCPCIALIVDSNTDREFAPAPHSVFGGLYVNLED